MRTSEHCNMIVAAIVRLHSDFPEHPIGEHISIALDGQDIYNVSDRELADLLMAYVTNLGIDEIDGYG